MGGFRGKAGRDDYETGLTGVPKKIIFIKEDEQMYKIKKCLAVLVCMAMVMAVMPGVALAGELKEESDAYTADGFGYRIAHGDGDYFDRDCCIITDYNGSNSRISVPSEIEGLPVTIIGSAAFDRDCITSITIPASVEELWEWPFTGCTNLQEIIVDPNNKRYKSIDGVLFFIYEEGGMSLEYYPRGNTRTSYVIPYGVKSIIEMYNEYLTSITIPDSVETIWGMYCPNLTDLYYTGSEEDWEKIESMDKFAFPKMISNATIHYNSPMPETAPLVPEIKVTVNGSKIDFDVPPTAIDGTTMLPVRLALEPLGAEFVWNGENNTVTITAKGKTIVLTIGSATALVDGIEKLMAQPAMATDGRTLIPIRFVSEELGYDVQWDGDTYTVIING